MNMDNVKTWTAALRSGEFTQGQGKLKTLHHFGEQAYHCCLGVACELIGLPQSNANINIVVFEGRNAVVEGLPPIEVVEWLGIDDDTNPSMDLDEFNLELDLPSGWYGIEGPDGNTTPASLAEANDLGLTFREIADLVDYFGVRVE